MCKPVAPEHIAPPPVTKNVDGTGFTVKLRVLVVPPVKVIVATPAPIPNTMPEDEPIAATEVLLLDHVPGPGPLSVTLLPTQTLNDGPEI